MAESLLTHSRRRLQNLRRDSTDDTALLGWLNTYNLSHLYSRIKKSNISIKKLSKYETDTIRNTAKYKLKLASTELSTFILAVTQYRNSQLLTEREQHIGECLNHLQFLQNELDIKQSNDILFVQERFKKMIKMLKKRETQLVREIAQKIEYKKAVLSDAADTLTEYKLQVGQQREKLVLTEQQNAAAVPSEMAEEPEVENVLPRLSSEEQMIRTRALLDEDVSLKYGKQRFVNIQNMSVEIPNYDELMAQLQRTGIVLDAFQFDDNDDNDDDNAAVNIATATAADLNQAESTTVDNNVSYKSLKSDAPVPLDTKLQCLCGAQLVLSTVDQAYAGHARIYCQFCNFECAQPHSSDIWHCSRGDIKAHPGGFDLCFLCGSKCFEARKADRQRQKEEETRKQKKTALRMQKQKHLHPRVKGHVHAKSNDGLQRPRTIAKAHMPRLVSSRSSEQSAPKHSRAYSAMKLNQWQRARSFEPHNAAAQPAVDTFTYPSQLQTLTNIGCDPVKARRLITKYEGDMEKVMMEINKV